MLQLCCGHHKPPISTNMTHLLAHFSSHLAVCRSSFNPTVFGRISPRYSSRLSLYHSDHPSTLPVSPMLQHRCSHHFPSSQPSFGGFSVCSGFAAAHLSQTEFGRMSYKPCKKSLFFASKSCKFRFIFCPVFTSKPIQKLNFPKVFLENMRNILQTNMLSVQKSALTTAFSTAATQHNLLTCKILTQYGKKNEKKVQKLMQNFTRFSH